MRVKQKEQQLFCALIILLTLGMVAAGCSQKGIKGADTLEPPYEVFIENLTLGEDMPDLKAVEEAVNKITIPAINCTIRIINIPIANQKSAIRLMRAQKERIDLVNTGRTDTLADMVKDQLLLPLDELLEQEGKTLLRMNDDLLDACRVNEKIYAIPATSYISKSVGFVYNAEMAEEYGILMAPHPNAEELEKIAEVLQGHGKYLIFPSDRFDSARLFTTLYPEFFSLSGNLYEGILSGKENDYLVRNPYATEEYKEYCQRIRSWVEKGWIPDQFLFSGLNGTDSFVRGDKFMTWSGVSPMEFALQSKGYPFRIGMVATGEAGITTQMVQENGWGISSSSENPEKAMQMLNFMYENADVANLLMNGIEGKEYRKVSEHIITYPEGQSSGDLKYRRDFTVFGDYRKIYQWEPMTEEDYQNSRVFYESDYSVSPYFGYIFDNRTVTKESDAVVEVLEDYLPALECGLLSDVPAAIDLLNQKLKEAGIERILAENQRQLDVWLNREMS